MPRIINLNKLKFIISSGSYLGSILLSIPIMASNPKVCPTDLKILSTQLANDLPAYTNRVNRRKKINQEVILISDPNLTPINLGNQPDANLTKQIFFTSLEQSWESNKIIYKQGYHWLIIAQNKQGWWLVTMFSRWGSYPKSSRITAKQESSQTAIGIAVQNWLRDCRLRSD